MFFRLDGGTGACNEKENGTAAVLNMWRSQCSCSVSDIYLSGVVLLWLNVALYICDSLLHVLNTIMSCIFLRTLKSIESNVFFVNKIDKKPDAHVLKKYVTY